MKERPILFSGPMVRAILDGRKTQTRRLVKPQPQLSLNGQWWHWPQFGGLSYWHASRPVVLDWATEKMFKSCPYGEPGDRLWVREPHALVPATAYSGSEGVRQTVNPSDPHEGAVYRAGWDMSDPGRWRTSIQMPRWASRITLEIAGVRCERLQDISEEDAEAEGVECFDPESDAPVCRVPGLTDWDYPSARDAYATLWDSINTEPGPRWADNPWVWVLSFNRVRTEGR